MSNLHCPKCAVVFQIAPWTLYKLNLAEIGGGGGLVLGSSQSSIVLHLPSFKSGQKRLKNNHLTSLSQNPWRTLCLNMSQKVFFSFEWSLKDAKQTIFLSLKGNNRSGNKRIVFLLSHFTQSFGNNILPSSSERPKRQG